MARTPTPNSMIILDGDKSEPTFSASRPSSSGKRRVIRREGSTTSLEFLPPDDKENDIHNYTGEKKKSSRCSPEGGSSRPSSRTSRAPPVRPDSGTGRRPPTPGTPTRQVALQAVKRRQESEADFGPLELDTNDQLMKKSDPHCQKTERKIRSAGRKKKESAHTKPDSSDDKQKQKDIKPNAQQDLEDSDQYDTDLEDGSGSSASEEEEEKPTAPTELMLEFLDCIYKKEWDIAKNLCRMILMFEPDNAEANKFSSLIEEKLRIVAERGSDEESGEEDSSDDSDSEDDSDDEDSSQDSSDADSEPEDDENDVISSQKDSGIGLVSSSGHKA